MIKLLQPHAVDTAPHRQVESVPSPTHRAYLPPIVGDPLDTGTADSYLPLPGTRYKDTCGDTEEAYPYHVESTLREDRVQKNKLVKARIPDEKHLWKEDTWN